MSGATVWDLSDEVLVHILSFLPAEDIARAVGVCSRWEQVVKHQRVWHGKSYLYLSGDVGGLPEALLVARALPVLKRVSIRKGSSCNFYLSGESAEFQVPNLQDEVVKTVISSLATEILSMEFCLLEDTLSNCLIVQPCQLKKVDICSFTTPWGFGTQATEAKLRALTNTLTHQPLLDLQSAFIRTGWCFPTSKKVVYDTEIFAALVTCPALVQLSIQLSCSLSWDILAKFPKLQTLELDGSKIQIPCSLSGNMSIELSNVQVLEFRNCEIDDIQFLDLCPKLHRLSIIDCKPLRSRELSCKSELRNLLLRNLDVGPEFLDALCPACPQLQRVVLDSCRQIGHTLPLGHCSQLSFLEVRSGASDIIRVVGLPSALRHFRLESSVATNQLAEIVQSLPHLEILDIINIDNGSLHFLCHCADLTELTLETRNLGRVNDFHDLGQLKNLQKLSLIYTDADFRPLAEVLSKMPQLRALQVTFRFSSATVPDLSFLRRCHHLHSLDLEIICDYYTYYTECQGLHGLVNQKELRKVQMHSLCFDIEAFEGVLPSMSHLEVLDIVLKGTECDFSFLSHCPQLTSLWILFVDVRVCHFAQLRRLKRLKLLVLDRLPEGQVPLLLEQVRRMPQLEYLGLERLPRNFLESWEWRRLLSSARP